MASAARPTRLSSGVVVVSLVERKLKFLLLRAYRNWDFPKGIVEPGEAPIDAALREVREETMLDDISFDWGLVYMETGPVQQRQDLALLHRAQQGDSKSSCPSIPNSACPSIKKRAGSAIPTALEHGHRALKPVVRWSYGIITHGAPPLRPSPAEARCVERNRPAAEFDDVAAHADTALRSTLNKASTAVLYVPLRDFQRRGQRALHREPPAAEVCGGRSGGRVLEHRRPLRKKESR
jgi:hypothetical protein